jgi:hypothetical protein
MAGTAVASARLLAGLLTMALVVSAPAHGDGLVSHVDAPEATRGPLDLTDVVFCQDGGDMVLRLATADAWSPTDLTPPAGGSLCVLLGYGVPRRRGRICVVGQDGATILRYARVDAAGQLRQERVMAAHVSRPSGRSVLAVFSPDEAGLEPGQRYAWRAESSWAACNVPAGCVDRVPQRSAVAATVADPPPPDQLAVPPTRFDGRDGARLPLDLAAVTFGQRGADMVLQVVASRAWRTSAPGALCLRLFGAAVDAPRGRICVDGRGGRPALGYERADGSALRPLRVAVLRPARRSLWATFSPRAVGLRPGWFSWRAESAGADGVDDVPNAGDVLTRIAPPPPACFGAAARDPELRCRNPALRLAVVPAPLDAAIEPNAPCQPLARGGLVAPCGFGIDPAGRSLALIGDSHAEHWRAAVEVVADAQGRHGLSITRTSCPLTTAKIVLPATARTDVARTHCARWNHEVPRWLARHPAVSTVFVSENTDAPIARADQVPGYMGAWKALPSSVKRIVVIRDPPHRAAGGAACIERAMARHRRAGLACAAPRGSALASDPAVAAAARLHSRRVRVVDLTRYMCSARLCYPVVGGALVHKDHHHLTAVFARTMGRYLLRALGRPSGTAPAAVGARSIAETARMCSPPRYPGSGYFTSLSVNGASCTTGRKLMLAYYRCRLRHGRAGRCRSTVLGYTCKETRNAIPTEINARVTCKRGRRTIVHTYQQNT